MKKSLNIRKNETLSAWCVRLSLHFSNKVINGEELLEVMHNLSVTSYIHGSNDATNAMKK